MYTVIICPVKTRHLMAQKVTTTTLSSSAASAAAATTTVAVLQRVAVNVNEQGQLYRRLEDSQVKATN